MQAIQIIDGNRILQDALRDVRDFLCSNELVDVDVQDYKKLFAHFFITDICTVFKDRGSKLKTVFLIYGLKRLEFFCCPTSKSDMVEFTEKLCKKLSKLLPFAVCFSTKVTNLSELSHGEKRELEVGLQQCLDNKLQQKYSSKPLHKFAESFGLTHVKLKLLPSPAFTRLLH